VERSLRCEACGSPVAAAARRCPDCGAATVRPGVFERALRLSEDLSQALGETPYFRSVNGLAYTLRGQLKGFLDDPDHPLSRRILRYLYLLSVESGPAELRHLLHFAGTLWLLPGTPLLVPAVGYLRRRHGEALRRAGRSDEAVRLRRLRAAQRRGEAPEGEADRLAEAGFERWHASLPRPSARG